MSKQYNNYIIFFGCNNTHGNTIREYRNGCGVDGSSRGCRREGGRPTDRMINTTTTTAAAAAAAVVASAVGTHE